MKENWRFEDLIDGKIEAILARPQMWGGEAALESVVLTLLLLRVEAIHGPDAEEAVLRRYDQHLHDMVGSGPLPLVEHIAEHGSTLTPVEVLRAFWQHERRIARQPEQVLHPRPEVGAAHFDRKAS